MFIDQYDMATEFAGFLVSTMGSSAWPGYDDPATKRRIVRLAKQHGFLDHLAHVAAPDGPLPVPVRFSEMRRDGNRKGNLRRLRAAGERLHAAACAAWMGHPDIEIGLVEDCMWALCETTTRPGEKTWTVLGSDGRGQPGVQLTSSRLAFCFAESVHLLRDRLDPVVVERMTREIYERALLPGTDWRYFNWWHWGRNNQNLVNVANLIGAGLYLIDDVYRLASFLMPLVEHLAWGLQGFTDDGGCTEGIDYWDYGFGHFLMAAVMLRHRTGGVVDIMRADPKIERICRYPLSVYLEDRFRACWADSFYGYVSLRYVLMINEFFDIPELYACCDPDLGGLSRGSALTMQTLSLYDGQQPKPAPFPDGRLPDLGTATAHVGSGKTHAALAVQGGHNGVHHNHNDIGSFVFLKKGVPVLTDPGYPNYSAVPDNFHAVRRYDCVYNNTFGHSAPIIDGAPQSTGEEYGGRLSVEPPADDGTKTIRLDLAGAYDVKRLRRLERVWRLAPKGDLFITDGFVFSSAPRELYEQFITYETAETDGDSVLIKSGRKRFRLEPVETAGRFTVERLEEESKLGRGQGVITRIRFFPETLAKDLALAFRVR